MAKHPLEEENDWVVVKKQKITILVPPASPIQTKIAKSRIKQLQTKSKKEVDGRSCNLSKRFLQHSTPKKVKSSGNCFLHESQSYQDNTEALGMHKAIYPRGSSGGLLSVTSVKHKETCNHILGDSSLRKCSIARVVDVVHNAVSSTKDQFFSPSRFLETLRDRPRPLIGALPIVNLKLRASNLEKRLERFGGLRKYLASLGLNQFIQIIEREKIDKFQLVNLTMHKLKDMGAVAVGPRRKLLYAIDCLCQPYLKVS
uniref:Connector enhancer of kinase suppressor of ras 2 n=1 Tax=Anthurium amnicola TaxID=1678845 RepID=A0A1D1YX27_9ARAE